MFLIVVNVLYLEHRGPKVIPPGMVTSYFLHGDSTWILSGMTEYDYIYISRLG
jgi:hypothetical protein